MKRLLHLNILFLFLLLPSALSACSRAASVSPATIPTASSVIDNPDKVVITRFDYTQIDPTHLGLNVDTKGHGGVGLTIRVSFNDSPNGDSSGQWHVIKELGVPKFSPNDRPVWDTSGLRPGKYLLKAEVKTPDDPNWQHSTVSEIRYVLK